ncbi:MAG: adenylate/guanylate cyclase domain-containing protein, partial [Bacteroidota bacterium]
MDNLEKRKLAAVMFADIKGYTALVAKDEELALSYVAKFRQGLIENTQKYSGEVKAFYGDGSLSIYDSAVDAVKCAIEMQTHFRTGEIIPVRIGIHLGDIAIKDETVYGDGVNVASRVESIGAPGNILISQSIEKQIRNQKGLETELMGKYIFKNVKDPMAVYAIKHPNVYLPNKKELSGPKGKRVNLFSLKNILPVFGILLTLFGFLYIQGFFPFNKTDIKEERIAIPSFKNFTGSDELDFIGEMTAHWITKELLQTSSANVVDFRTNEEIKQITTANIVNIDQLFAKQSGALNIVEGSFNQHSKDSLSFTVFIKNIESGKVLHSFETIRFKSDEPRKGIKELANLVKGYWDSKDDLLLSIPNFEAYKLYIEARKQWEKNDSLAKVYLLSSIKADPNFLDAYFLLLGNEYNNGNYKAVASLIKSLELKTDLLNNREQNILSYYNAILNGKNQLAYDFMLKDLASYERDFFTTTEFMV